MAAKSLYDGPEDFEAEITILPGAVGGRRPPAFNGILWNFIYAEDDPTDQFYMIWPEFLDEAADALASDIPLRGTYRARMYIMNREVEKPVHVLRIKQGTFFFCMQGSRKVARGRVTKVTGLLAEPPLT